MIKHWNWKHGDYLQSYHIEVMALKIFTSKLEDITWDVFTFFKEGAALLHTPLWHADGFVDDYLNVSNRLEVKRRFENAAEKARNAWYETFLDRSNHKTAIETWKSIFGEKYPSYG
jgi:hypothetical protein